MDDTTGAGPAAAVPPGIVRKFDHVAIAVHDLAEAVPLYHGVLGGELIAGGDDEGLRLRTLQLRFAPGTKVELMQPLDRGSYLATYLDKHGQGFHHMTCIVDDVSEAVARLEAAGFETVDTDLSSKPSWQETFVRPKSAFGTLLQLARTELEWGRPLVPGATVDDVVAGRLVWNGARPHFRNRSSS